MAAEGIGLSGSDIVSILQVGAPGLALLIALLAFLLLRQVPEKLEDDRALKAYLARAGTIRLSLWINVLLVVIAYVLPYAVPGKGSKVLVVVQEGSQFAKFSLAPIRLSHRSDMPLSLPAGGTTPDRVLVSLSGEDQLDLSVGALLERISDQKLALNAFESARATSTKQGGFDDPR
jgi:hypothetical protein